VGAGLARVRSSIGVGLPLALCRSPPRSGARPIKHPEYRSNVYPEVAANAANAPAARPSMPDGSDFFRISIFKPSAAKLGPLFARTSNAGKDALAESQRCEMSRAGAGGRSSQTGCALMGD
jgi:hypothetical protein